MTDFFKKGVGGLKIAQEQERHRNHRERLCAQFAGREAALEEIKDFLESDTQKIRILTGPTGSGKSSIMAKASKIAENKSNNVYFRFAGISKPSSNEYGILRSLCEEIAQDFSLNINAFPKYLVSYHEMLDQEQISYLNPAKLQDLRKIFLELLSSINASRKLVILIDGYERIQDNLFWLLQEHPSNTKIVASVGSGSVEPLWAEVTQTVGRLPDEEARAILRKWLEKEPKAFSLSEVQEVTDLFRSLGLPLHLRLLFELKKTGNLPVGHIQPLDGDKELLDLYFDYLEKKYSPGTFSKKVALSVCSRHGRLRNWSSHLFHIPELGILSHKTVLEHAQKRYSDDIKTVHSRLAKYFEKQPLFLNGNRKTPNRQKLSQQPWHQVHAGRWQELFVQTLGSFDFIMAKVGAELLEELVQDYVLMYEMAPDSIRSDLESWRAFVNRNFSTLSRGTKQWPTYKILLQLATEEPEYSPVAKGAKQYLAEGKVDWIWLKSHAKMSQCGPEACVFSFDGNSEALVLSSDSILTYGQSNDMSIWDLQTCRRVTRLTGHTKEVTGAIKLRNGNILSWGQDGLIGVWDYKKNTSRMLRSGHIKKAQEVSDGRILAYSCDSVTVWNLCSKKKSQVKLSDICIRKAYELKDGRVLLQSDDEVLRIWDPETQILNPLEGHTETIAGVIELDDGKLVSWSYGEELIFWDTEDIHPAEIVEHTGQIAEVLKLSDGRILSWSHESFDEIDDDSAEGFTYSVNTRILLSDPLTLQTIELFGHKSYINGAIELDNSRVLTWSNDWTLRIWDLHTGSSTVLAGHTDKVRKALLLGDGRILSCSDDFSLRLWDLETLNSKVFDGHTAVIEGMLQMHDSMVVSWSRNRTLLISNLLTGDSKALMISGKEIKDVQVLKDNLILVSYTWSTGTFCEPYMTTFAIWDTNLVASLQPQKCIEQVTGSLELSDHRFVFWGKGPQLGVLDCETGINRLLEGHEGEVIEAFEANSGWFVTHGVDEMVWAWNIDKSASKLLEGKTGSADRLSKMYRLPGHQNPKRAFLLKDGRVATWAPNNSLRVWDKSFDSCVRSDSHESMIGGAKQLIDGRLLIWHVDGTLRIWDVNSGETSLLGKHGEKISSVMECANGMLLSWGRRFETQKLCFPRLWNPYSGRFKRLREYTDFLDGALEMRNGSVLTWSSGQLRVLDPECGRSRMLSEKRSRITGAFELSTGDVLTWSENKRLDIWNVLTGCSKEIGRHSGYITEAFEAREGDIVSCSYGKLETWSSRLCDRSMRIWSTADGRVKVIKNIGEVYRNDYGLLMAKRSGALTLIVPCCEDANKEHDNDWSIICWCPPVFCEGAHYIDTHDHQIAAVAGNFCHHFVVPFFGNKRISLSSLRADSPSRREEVK